MRGPELALAGFALLGVGCSLHAIPATISPREMVLPYLSKECLRSIPRGEHVQVLDEGAAPQRKLRFVHGEQDVSIHLLSADRGFARPDYVVDMEWIDTGVRGQGCHQFEVSGPKTSHIGDPVVGVAKISVTGTTSYATDALDEKSYEVERDLAWALDRTDPLLPQEPVGVGAVWRVHAEGQRSGERLEIDAYYKLTSLQSSHATVEVMRTVRRPAQRIRGPRGYSKKVKAKTTRERGVLDFDLRKRPIASGRFWDDKGREIVRIQVAYR
jgi:hypothetical protein